ncbi:MAG: type IV secretory system conjugative DNA transfer family protein [Alphaproteobacteria bacterium]|jgi:type IV secretion system protein VirD4|nr:type IV secretory system conjugative DNA transfer family protein [Alphaproteobacteria bacterium]OJV12559.1 MAG: hypothetical protein BGO27_03445 [Alphaproteobacteria bacterium 33-17]
MLDITIVFLVVNLFLMLVMIPNIMFNMGYSYVPFVGAYQLFKSNGLNLPWVYLVSLMLAAFGMFFIVNFVKEKVKKDKNARWATFFDLFFSEINFKEGIVLGKKGFNYLFTKTNTSILLFAPPGTGKTAGFIIPTMFTCSNSIVVHDPKGEIYAKTKEQRSKFSDILVFSPSMKESCVFNPFDSNMIKASNKNVADYVEMVLSILMPNSAETSGNGKFFNDRAKLAISTIACYLIELNGSTSLPDIRDFYTSQDAKEVFKAILRDPKISDLKYLVSLCNDISNDTHSSEQWSGVSGCISNILSVYASENVRNAMSGNSSFAIEDLRNHEIKPITIYLIVPDQDRDWLSPVISLFFDRVSSNLLSNGEPKAEARSITLIMDEFPRLGKVKSLVDLPAISRSYKFNCIFVAQTINQLYDIYGKDFAQVLQSFCKYRIVLKQNDIETANLISQAIGKTVIKKENVQTNQQGKSTSVTYEKDDLVSPQTITSLPEDKCIIISDLGTNTPIFASIPFWFNNRRLITWLD